MVDLRRGAGVQRPISARHDWPQTSRVFDQERATGDRAAAAGALALEATPVTGTTGSAGSQAFVGRPLTRKGVAGAAGIVIRSTAVPFSALVVRRTIAGAARAAGRRVKLVAETDEAGAAFCIGYTTGLADAERSACIVGLTVAVLEPPALIRG